MVTEKQQQGTVLILGYGEMGHAFESLLSGHERMEIWCRDKERRGECQLEEMAARAELLIFCLPVMAHASVATRLSAQLQRDTICLSIAKGLDKEGEIAANILRTTLPANQPLVLMYGPMISEEIVAGRPAFAQVASPDDALYKRVASHFHNSNLYLEYSQDVTGTSWSVILKNVYAILFGIADELGLGDNMRGFLMVQTLRELSSIVEGMGGDAQTPYLWSGLGDLVTTTTSEDSHHHTLGRMLARGETEDISGEGVNTLHMVIKHRLIDIERYPLFKMASHAVDQPSECRELFDRLLAQLHERA